MKLYMIYYYILCNMNIDKLAVVKNNKKVTFLLSTNCFITFGVFFKFIFDLVQCTFDECFDFSEKYNHQW